MLPFLKYLGSGFSMKIAFVEFNFNFDTKYPFFFETYLKKSKE